VLGRAVRSDDYRAARPRGWRPRPERATASSTDVQERLDPWARRSSRTPEARTMPGFLARSSLSRPPATASCHGVLTLRAISRLPPGDSGLGGYHCGQGEYRARSGALVENGPKLRELWVRLRGCPSESRGGGARGRGVEAPAREPARSRAWPNSANTERPFARTPVLRRRRRVCWRRASLLHARSVEE
jgi:hypothetical protein